eukprot:TRINITY_DN38473_c0_g1_i1.p1 TRINITY_DN38473_c0_g1~~TRINITY_DN38473_c0_g1_i1.p1  ORF type:complete len:138 (+),score=69.62 TRINITY_DN38473_c0_g1_i1:57-470(+)
MAMTGVVPTDACVTEFEQLKTKSAYQGLEFAIEGDKIDVTKKFDKGTSFADFLAAIPKDDARYYIWDYCFEDDGVSKTKLFFITWNPDAGKVKTRMLYSGSKDALKKKIAGGLIELQANDIGDLDEKDILGKAKKGY